MIQITGIDSSFSYYIDAGTSTIIIQFLIAGAIAGLIFIKGFWRKIVAFFKGNKKNDD